MADDAATTTEDTQITFNVKAANDQKHVLTLPNTTTVADLKAKLSTPEYADVPAERQRLIYSGRVLKDPDTLASVKIKDGHTVHLVKGAASNARQNPANQGTSSTASGGNTQTPQVPTNIAAGTGNNPLAGLTGARYAGFHGLPGMDMTDPTNPFSPGCAAGDGYVHDAECLVYRGPDKRYEGRDICYGYNEDTITIYDVTDKVGNTTNIISITTFPGAEYIHQGAVNDVMNQEYLFMDDEFDERDAKVGPMTQGLPTTHIFDIRDLEHPIYTGNYAGKTRSIDHNQYVVDGYLYQSNYGNGLNVVDISTVKEDPTGAGMCEAGFFDVYPEDDENEGGGTVAFLGSWSSYANFKSGFIFVHTIERGSFVVKMTSKKCPSPPKCKKADSCLKSLQKKGEESEEFCGKFLVRQNDDKSLVPDYAKKSCGGKGKGNGKDKPKGKKNDLVANVSSACACIPTTTVPELPRTTSRPAPPTVLPPKA